MQSARRGAHHFALVQAIVKQHHTVGGQQPMLENRIIVLVVARLVGVNVNKVKRRRAAVANLQRNTKKKHAE